MRHRPRSDPRDRQAVSSSRSASRAVPVGAHAADIIDYAVRGMAQAASCGRPRPCDWIARGRRTTKTVRVTVTLSCSGSATAGGATLIDVPIALAAPIGSRVVLTRTAARRSGRASERASRASLVHRWDAEVAR